MEELVWKGLCGAELGPPAAGGSLCKAAAQSPPHTGMDCVTIGAMPVGQSVGLHLRIAGGAVWGWLVAQFLDSVTVGLLWFVGLLLIKMPWPWALVWAVVGAVCQFIPHLGPVLGLIGPGMTAAAKITSNWENYEQLLYVLILYAVIMILDGFVLQPYFMRRKAQVPMWASILTPIVLGFVIPFWGLLLAPPLLAVVYAYKARRAKNAMPPRNLSC